VPEAELGFTGCSDVFLALPLGDRISTLPVIVSLTGDDTQYFVSRA